MTGLHAKAVCLVMLYEHMNINFDMICNEMLKISFLLLIYYFLTVCFSSIIVH